jgi:hypothetical protein
LIEFELRFPTHKVVVNNEENVKAEKPYEKGYVKYLTDITIAGGVCGVL